jgi:hypothetical protein
VKEICDLRLPIVDLRVIAALPTLQCGKAVPYRAPIDFLCERLCLERRRSLLKLM